MRIKVLRAEPQGTAEKEEFFVHFTAEPHGGRVACQRKLKLNRKFGAESMSRMLTTW